LNGSIVLDTWLHLKHKTELQMSPPKTIFVSGSLLLLDGFDFEQLEEVH